MSSQLVLEEPLRYVGKSVQREDAVEKVTGRAVYGVDFSLPRMLHGKVKRSPFPHAVIEAIDTSKASAVPGVRAVVTAADAPNSLYGAGLSDTPLLAKGTVRYVGEPVVAVAAETQEAAEDATDLIEVKYRELPALYDAEQAAKENPAAVLHPELMTYKVTPRWPPQLDPKLPNVSNHVAVRKGNVEGEFRKSSIIVENRFATNLVQHVHTEPNAAVALSASDGSVTIWTPTQAMYRMRHMLSQALDMPPNKIRIVTTEVGGGFGNKLNVIIAEGIAALLARKAKRPVRIRLTREEVFSSTSTRHPFVVYVKDAVTKTGRITARRITAFLDGGAYSAGSGVAVGRTAVFAAATTYDIPNLEIDTYRVYTNRAPSGAFRGFGTMQMVWATECQMDIIAKRLGIQPVEIRLANALKKGGRSGLGELIPDVTHEACLLEASRLIDLGRREELPYPWKQGKGVSISEKGSGEPGSCAEVRYAADGMVEVRVSVQEMGQGVRTVVRQMVADELKVPIEKVRLAPSDTSVTPYDPGAFSSRQTINVGNAVILACRDLKKNIFEAASERLGARPESLSTKDAVVYSRDGGHVDVEALFMRNKARYGVFRDKGDVFAGFGTWFVDTGEIDPKTGQGTLGRLNTMYSNAAWGVEVRVNAETGVIKVQRCVCVVDSGRVINPSLAEGQVEGAVSMGISTALYEELVLERGVVVNGDFKDYKLLNMEDATPVQVKFLDTASEEGPYGAKPLGEIGIVGVAPAIANAVADALGVRVHDLPITAEKVLRLVKKVEQS